MVRTDCNQGIPISPNKCQRLTQLLARVMERDDWLQAAVVIHGQNHHGDTEESKRSGCIWCDLHIAGANIINSNPSQICRPVHRKKPRLRRHHALLNGLMRIITLVVPIVIKIQNLIEYANEAVNLTFYVGIQRFNSINSCGQTLWN